MPPIGSDCQANENSLFGLISAYFWSELRRQRTLNLTPFKATMSVGF